MSQLRSCEICQEPLVSPAYNSWGLMEAPVSSISSLLGLFLIFFLGLFAGRITTRRSGTQQPQVRLSNDGLAFASFLLCVASNMQCASTMLYCNRTLSLFSIYVHLYTLHSIQCTSHRISPEYHLAAASVFQFQYPLFVPNEPYRRRTDRIALPQSKIRNIMNSSRPKAGRVKRAWLTGSHFAYSADRWLTSSWDIMNISTWDLCLPRLSLDISR